MNLRIRSFYPLSLTLAACLLIPASGHAQDEPESASDSKKPEPVKVSGVLEAIVAHQLSPESEQIESWTIKKILPHGAMVKKGQTVVWLDTEQPEKKLRDAEIELQLAKLALEGDEFKHKQFLETQRLDREAAIRSVKKAREDYDHFMQTDRRRLIDTADQNLKSATAALENAQEELEQLEQMYKEDDLTEQSEEIVLKRAKQAVESAEFRLEGVQIQSDLMLNRGVAEQTAQQEDALARAELAYQQTIQDLVSARQQRDIELAKKRTAFQEQQQKLDELRSERKRSVLTSPIDGILLHGELTRGRLSDKPSTLDQDTKVTANQVIVTIVDPNKLQVRVDLAESELASVQPGASCDVTVTAVPSFVGKGSVKSVSSVPYAATKYDCVVTLKKLKASSELLPTMTCSLEFAPQPTGKDDDAR